MNRYPDDWGCRGIMVALVIGVLLWLVIIAVIVIF